MRICMFTSSFLPTIGGFQFQVKWLAEELARQGEEVYLLTPKDAGKNIDACMRALKDKTLKFLMKVACAMGDD